MSDFGYKVFKDTTEKPVENVKKENPMFKSILSETIGYGVYGLSSYTRNDMETMYNQIVYECILAARKHTLDKFGIHEPFHGTTEIEKALAQHFGVDE